MLQYVFCLACRNFCLQLGLICVTKKEEDFFFSSSTPKMEEHKKKKIEEKTATPQRTFVGPCTEPGFHWPAQAN